jgi:hypothetical protein
MPNLVAVSAREAGRRNVTADVVFGTFGEAITSDCSGESTKEPGLGTTSDVSGLCHAYSTAVRVSPCST